MKNLLTAQSNINSAEIKDTWNFRVKDLSGKELPLSSAFGSWVDFTCNEGESGWLEGRFFGSLSKSLVDAQERLEAKWALEEASHYEEDF